MNREQLEHVIQAAAQVADDPDLVVIGSQSVLGALPEAWIPIEASASIEVDVTFFDDLDDVKSDQVDGAIGELSPFHETYGYYAQGVSITTAVLPVGWQDRLVIVESASTTPGRAHCLDPHDCVVSKLVAGRDKDMAFAEALLRERLIDPDTVAERVALLDGVDPSVLQRMHSWLAATGLRLAPDG